MIERNQDSKEPSRKTISGWLGPDRDKIMVVDIVPRSPIQAYERTPLFKEFPEFVQAVLVRTVELREFDLLKKAFVYWLISHNTINR